MTELQQKAFDALKKEREDYKIASEARLIKEYEDAYLSLSENLPIQKIEGNMRQFLLEGKAYYWSLGTFHGIAVSGQILKPLLSSGCAFSYGNSLYFNDLVGYGRYLEWEERKKGEEEMNKKCSKMEKRNREEEDLRRGFWSRLLW
jgi:hypothetical protein